MLHDGPANGRAVVGGLTHFGFALVDHEGAPVVHRDAAVRVEQAGRTLFATHDAHDYDGLYAFDVVFDQGGPYRVVAESDGFVLGAFTGEAVLPANETVADVVFEAAPSGPASNAFTATLDIVGPDGATLPHTDALVELRRAGDLRLVHRVHVHIHEEPVAFTMGHSEPGDHVVQVTAYNAFPTGSRPDVRAVVQSFPLTLGPLAAPATPTPPAEARVLEPAGETATADGFTLHGMYDPQSQVGVGQPVRLSALVTNASGLPQAHVDFELEVRGPRGLVFQSASLHEYDGHYEHLFVPTMPGAYDATLTAHVDGTTLALPYHVQALPPVAAGLGGTGQGPVTVTVDHPGAPEAGVPTSIRFHLEGPAGPAAHTEVDVSVLREGEAARHRFKLHTHGSGSMEATLTFPEAGEWVVLVDPLPTLPEPVVFQGPGGPGAPIRFPVTVADSVLDDLAPLSGGEGSASVPGPAAGLLLAAAAAVALATRKSF